MVNQNLYNFFGNIKYEDLNKLKNLILLPAGVLIPTATFGVHDNVVSGIMYLASLLSVAMSHTLKCSSIEMYSKETKEIQELYKEIIKNYCKTNEIFGLTDPVEIFTMYTEALKNGYLSYNKTFTVKEPDIKDIETILAPMIVTGSGLCRHINLSLRDIMRTSGFDSSVMTVYNPHLEKEEMQEKVFEKAINNFIDKYGQPSEEKIRQIQEQCSIVIDRQYQTTKSNALLKKYGNHAVTVVVNNGIVHILDSLKEKTYKMSQNSGFITDKTGKQIKICNHPRAYLGTISDLLDQPRQLEYNSAPFEEDKIIKEKTIVKFKDGINVFEDFYKENKEIYEEISEKIKVFKR